VSLVTIKPTELPISLDQEIARNKISRLLQGADEKGGIDSFIEALEKKHRFFNDALIRDALSQLQAGDVEILLETVFTARRKLNLHAITISHQELVEAIEQLLYGSEADVNQRLDLFVQTLGFTERKMQRAVWDWGAEMLHYTSPEAIPLMSRWVWDAKVQSGAMREFIRGGDSMNEIPLTQTPGEFEAARVWIAERLREQGFYRDIAMLTNLVLAQAYTDYVLGMSKGLGMFESEFGGKLEPIEFIAKLLGIEPARRNGKSRVKKQILQ